MKATIPGDIFDIEVDYDPRPAEKADQHNNHGRDEPESVKINEVTINGIVIPVAEGQEAAIEEVLLEMINLNWKGAA